jgi:dolichyl-phosphate beta-glucosyltransferase
MAPASNDPKIALSVVVPAHDEQARIQEPLRAMVDYLSKRSDTSELIVVDDGSRDATFDVVREILADAPFRCEVVRYERNRGKGHALKVGFARARGERILFTDADLSTPIEEADRLLAALDDGSDMVLGSRKLVGARLEVRQPWYREKLGAVFTWLVERLIAPVSDATCGFKAYRGDIGRELFGAVRIYDWSFDAELLFIAKRRGYRMAEIPVTWRDTPGTNVRILRDIVGSLVGLARIRLHGLRGLHEHAQPADVHLDVWSTPAP